MTKNELALAIQIPVSERAEFQKLATELAEDCTIKFNTPISGEDEPSPSLSFDPATGVEFIWIAIKVAGLAAETIAAKVIAEFAYKKYQERKEQALKTVRVRFPDGEIFNLTIEDPESMKRLKKLISSSARK